MSLSASQNPSDPFHEARHEGAVLECPFQGKSIPMILRHGDVRKAAKDWQTFSSDAPFRVPIPSEEEVRSIRQLPIEADPPAHTAFRQIVEPFFQRAKDPEVMARVKSLINEMIQSVIHQKRVDAISDFIIPLQSRALTHLLNVPESEAEIWILWGVHVFKADTGKFKNGSVLDDYLDSKFDSVAGNSDDDFFSTLARATYQNRPLTRDEMVGFANLTFAGGRDTIIHSVSSILAYFARNPEALDYLRQDPKRIIHAAEEFFRVFMPLTHIGRVCPVETDVHGVTVNAGERISLGWASANFDDTVFANPSEIRLDRKPNPHLSFGFGTHLCLGAPHARLVVKSLLESLTQHVATIDLLDAVDHVENESCYRRTIGFDSLQLRFNPRKPEAS